MDPPSLVYIGDSLIYENVAFTMPASLSGGYGLISTTIPYKVGQNLQRKRPALKPTIYQNMGIGGQITSQIASRFAVDVLAKHPQIAVIEGGTNDLISGTISKDQFLVNWKTMLDACAANGIKVMVLLIWPGDATDIYGNALLTNEKMVMRDDWNAALTALSETYHNSRVVNVDSFIGQYRPGGPPGNLWDLIPAYTSDHLHLTEAGYAQVARALSMALSPTCPAIPLLLLN